MVFDLTLPSADGEPRFGLATYVPHRDQRGKVVGFFALIQDITERRRAQAYAGSGEGGAGAPGLRAHRLAAAAERDPALRGGGKAPHRRRAAKAKVEAERANISKTQFLADASHDLLQPLNAARLFVSAIAGSGKLPADLTPMIGRVDQALANVEDILNILLDISKLDAGKVAVNFRRVPLVAMMASLRDEIAPLAERSGVEFPACPCTLSVSTDVRLLRRVLQNLLTNACRYTPNGRILFGARRRGDAVEIAGHRHRHRHTEGQARRDLRGVPAPDRSRRRRRRATASVCRSCGVSAGCSIIRSRCVPSWARARPSRCWCRSPRIPATLSNCRRRSRVAPRRSTACASWWSTTSRSVLEGMTNLLGTWRCRVIAASDAEGTAIRRLETAENAGASARRIITWTTTGSAPRRSPRSASGSTREIPAAVITADHSPAIQDDVRKLMPASRCC